MDPLYGTSIVAAFVAGVAALFAPCCISVLLPSYLGSVFKERYKVVLMTFVFFLGVLTVFLPIGLGASAMARVFNRYHNLIFTAGGLMLAALGIALVFGKDLSLPSPIHRDVRGHGVGSVYVLGLFSAVATTCCAPVLAGVLALSAASGSLFWGGAYTLSYVLGMVAPLFFIAAFLDKINFTGKFMSLRKPRSFEVLGLRWRFVLSELTAGIVFLAMGAYILYRALTDQLIMESELQLEANIFLAGAVHSIHRWTVSVPELAWAVLVVAVFLFLVFYAVIQSRKP